jgi:uncharacterized membrane protein
MNIILFIAGMVTFASLDYLWLAIIAKNFYIHALGTHVTLKDGSLVPYLPAVPVVYILGCVFLWVFVVSRATNITEVILYGALAGFLLYGFYDFTNLATLRDYPWSVTIVDILWGTALMSIVAVVMFLVKNLLA